MYCEICESDAQGSRSAQISRSQNRLLSFVARAPIVSLKEAAQLGRPIWTEQTLGARLEKQNATAEPNFFQKNSNNHENCDFFKNPEKNLTNANTFYNSKQFFQFVTIF